MLQKIRKHKHTREADLRAAEAQFSASGLGVLDHLLDDEEARKLLMCTNGDFATIGFAGSTRRDIIELAIDLGNKDFVAHRHCQEILEREWCGRSRLGGRIMLQRNPASQPWGLLQINLQIVLFFLQLLPFSLNDLSRHRSTTKSPYLSLSISARLHHVGVRSFC